MSNRQCYAPTVLPGPQRGMQTPPALHEWCPWAARSLSPHVCLKHYLSRIRGLNGHLGLRYQYFFRVIFNVESVRNGNAWHAPPQPQSSTPLIVLEGPGPRPAPRPLGFTIQAL